MTQGRGAWTARGKQNGFTMYARFKGTPRDGQVLDYTGGMEPEMVTWYATVHLGVLAIQRLLTDAGYFTQALTGEYGWVTKRAALAYQTDQELDPDGVIGPATMKALLDPTIARTANPALVYGLGRQESGFDPAAQGWTTPADFGIWQFNTAVHEITAAEACDVAYAARAVDRRITAALTKYAGNGPEVRTACTILQHRSPAAADYWYENGEAGSTESADYVANVLRFSEEWAG